MQKKFFRIIRRDRIKKIVGGERKMKFGGFIFKKYLKENQKVCRSVSKGLF